MFKILFNDADCFVGQVIGGLGERGQVMVNSTWLVETLLLVRQYFCLAAVNAPPVLHQNLGAAVGLAAVLAGGRGV